VDAALVDLRGGIVADQQRRDPGGVVERRDALAHGLKQLAGERATVYRDSGPLLDGLDGSTAGLDRRRET
jgi:hypothetical protein